MNLSDRFHTLINKDKANNPKYLIEVLKSDFYYLINNYFEVDFNDINIEIELNHGKYQIKVNSIGDRLKLMSSLPD